MPVKRPERRLGPAPTPAPAGGTLMDRQDTRGKGDSSSSRKKGKLLTVWVTDEFKAELNAYAAEHDIPVSQLVREGLALRMGRG